MKLLTAAVLTLSWALTFGQVEAQCNSTCDSGECIPTSFVCNGRPDCNDFSDEIGCSPCNSSQFRCRFGECIPSSLVCDSTPDCSDDEIGCFNCTSDEFTCDNGECIDASGRCNGSFDCSDSRDETECTDVAMLDLIANPANISEGSFGTPITVSLVSGSSRPDADVIITFAVSGTATAGADFEAPGNFTYTTTGNNDQTFNLEISEDSIAELSETIILQASVLSGPAQFSTDMVTITLKDDDVPFFALSTTKVDESAGSAVVVVELRGTEITFDIAVTVQTRTATSSPSPATEGDDYTATSVVLTFMSGDREGAAQNVSIPIINDLLVENTEVFDVQLSVPEPIPAPTGTIVIFDDDEPCPVNCKECLTNDTCEVCEDGRPPDPIFLCDEKKPCPVNCKECLTNDTCEVCEDGRPPDPVFLCDRTEEPSSGGGGGCGIGCIIGIIVALLVVLAIAAIIAGVIYGLYRYQSNPTTKLKNKNTKGLNGVAKDNPLYLDPRTVEESAVEPPAQDGEP